MSKKELKRESTEPISDETNVLATQRQANSPQKYRLSVLELVDLFKHFDQIHAGKENLFVPIAMAIIPAILVSWKDVSTQIVMVGGAASILLYLYHVLVTLRFSEIQGTLFRRLRELTPDVERIVTGHWQVHQIRRDKQG